MCISRWLLGITRVQLDELEIVDFEEGFGGLAVPGQFEKTARSPAFW